MASTKEAEAAAAATPLHRGLHLGDNGRPISTSGNGQDYSQTPTHQFAAGEDQSHSWLTRKMPFLQTRRGKIITVIVILVIIGGGLAGLAALPKKNNGNGNGGGSGSVGSGGDSEMITDDGYFYGQSPAVYPSREFCFCPFVSYLGIFLLTYRTTISKYDGSWNVVSVVHQGAGPRGEDDAGGKTKPHVGGVLQDWMRGVHPARRAAQFHGVVSPRCWEWGEECGFCEFLAEWDPCRCELE